MSIRVNEHGIVILNHGAIHSCKSASIKDNTLRYTLHNNWETHVKIRSKKKQSWLHKTDYAITENPNNNKHTIDRAAIWGGSSGGTSAVGG